jgi:UDP-N-acetylmuramate--alanine ligase
MMNQDLMSSFVRRLHFVGIGGVGMSGIAEVLLNLGYEISGSDVKESEMTHHLKSLGAKICYGHKAANIRGAQVLVISSAISADNPEVFAAHKSKIPVIARAEMLAEIGRMKKTVTVAGSHGKTTTTSMVAMALRAAKARPTMIIGGRLKNIHSGAKLGMSDYLVAEADESDGSFVHLSPLVAVVTNIDNDHLDYHKTMGALKAAFVAHLERLPFYGAAVLCSDDTSLSKIAASLRKPVITYGFEKGARWTAKDVRLSRGGSDFEAFFDGKRSARIRLSIPGKHNVLNSLAALAVGNFLGFDRALLAKGLSEFKGVGRRLDLIGRAGGIEFVDDYGHHPTEIRATVLAVSNLWKAKRVIAIFQPHRFSRTKLLAQEFGPAFKGADLVFVTDIYPAGEKPIAGVSSKLILDSLKKSGITCAPFTNTEDLASQLRSGDVVLTLGAGDVWKIGADLLRRARS